MPDTIEKITELAVHNQPDINVGDYVKVTNVAKTMLAPDEVLVAGEWYGQVTETWKEQPADRIADIKEVKGYDMVADRYLRVQRQEGGIFGDDEGKFPTHLNVNGKTAEVIDKLPDGVILRTKEAERGLFKTLLETMMDKEDEGTPLLPHRSRTTWSYIVDYVIWLLSKPIGNKKLQFGDRVIASTVEGFQSDLHKITGQVVKVDNDDVLIFPYWHPGAAWKPCFWVPISKIHRY